MLEKQLGRGLSVIEEGVDLLDVILVDGVAPTCVDQNLERRCMGLKQGDRVTVHRE